MKFKLPSLSTIIFCFIIYKCIFGGDGDDETNSSGTGGGIEPNYQVEEKAKEVLDKASDLIDEAREKYIKKDDPIANPVDISVFPGKDDKLKDEKIVEDLKKDEPEKLERLDVPSNKVKEKKPVFKSID